MIGSTVEERLAGSPTPMLPLSPRDAAPRSVRAMFRMPPTRLVRPWELALFVVAYALVVVSAWVVFVAGWLNPVQRATGGLVTRTLVANLILLGVVLLIALGLGRLRPADVGLRRSQVGAGVAVSAAAWLLMQLAGRAGGVWRIARTTVWQRPHRGSGLAGLRLASSLWATRSAGMVALPCWLDLGWSAGRFAAGLRAHPPSQSDGQWLIWPRPGARSAGAWTARRGVCPRLSANRQPVYRSRPTCPRECADAAVCWQQHPSDGHAGYGRAGPAHLATVGGSEGHHVAQGGKRRHGLRQPDSVAYRLNVLPSVHAESKTAACSASRMRWTEGRPMHLSIGKRAPGP